MPQKYGKHMIPMPGYARDSLPPERAKALREAIDAARAKRHQKAAELKFKAEPEELAVLKAIESLPDGARQAAAEGALIARVGRRKKLF